MPPTMTLTGILDANNVDYTFHAVPGYGTPANPSTRGATNLAFNPVGIIIHYPVGIDDVGHDSILQLVIDGRPGAPKPIYQIYVDHAAGNTVHVISNGRANHAGNGWSGRILEATRDLPPTDPNPGDDIGGNRYWYGITLEGPPTTSGQQAATAEVCAAICRHYGWTANRIIGHEEWSNRKSDPDFNMTTLRQTVTDQLAKGTTMGLLPIKYGDEGSDVTYIAELLEALLGTADLGSVYDDTMRRIVAERKAPPQDPDDPNTGKTFGGDDLARLHLDLIAKQATSGGITPDEAVQAVADKLNA